MNEVLETAEWVARRSAHVTIDKQALKRFCEAVACDNRRVPPWEGRYHFYDGGIRTVEYFLVLDTLNFCFWPVPGHIRWEVEIGSEPLSGYYGLAASLKKAFDSGTPMGDPSFLESLDRAGLLRILGGEGELQLMEERVQVLQELGRVLRTEYEGKAHRLIESASGSALRLARLLATKLSSFRDEAVYQGRKIFFYKRAQILAADLHGAFGGSKWGAFTDLDQLTAFADYKLPQVLRHLGIFLYSEELAKKIDSCTLLEAGSPEEVEIRANTVWAVELIRQGLGKMGRERKAFEMDWTLWNMGQDDAFREKPYHRTMTIFY